MEIAKTTPKRERVFVVELKLDLFIDSMVDWHDEFRLRPHIDRTLLKLDCLVDLETHLLHLLSEEGMIF